MLVERIRISYQELKDGQEVKLEKEYMDRLFRRGEPSRFEVGGVVFNGIIRGVSDFGELLVEREGELCSYGHGEISLKEACRVT